MQERAHPISRGVRGFLPVVVDVETGGVQPRGGRPAGDRGGACSTATGREDGAGARPGPATSSRSREPTSIPRRSSSTASSRTTRCARRRRNARRSGTSASRSGTSSGRLAVPARCWSATTRLSTSPSCTRRRGAPTTGAIPFHLFTAFDTATLGGLAYGQTVLARTAEAADSNGTRPRRTPRSTTRRGRRRSSAGSSTAGTSCRARRPPAERERSPARAPPAATRLSAGRGASGAGRGSPTRSRPRASSRSGRR